jgi:molybdate transport system substrate-binding protein
MASGHHAPGRPIRAGPTWLTLLAGLCLLASAAAADELLVAAAVSLREPLVEIGRRYDAQHPGERVSLSFGASSVLAAQARAGAPIDVFVSADERIVDRLEAEGLVPGEDRFTLVSNRLVVIAAQGLDFPLAGPEDLARPEVRWIAIAEISVPVGRYARAWLTRRGLLERLEPRIVPTAHARATLAAVDYGHADAAIVYATDARVARSARVAFEIPEAEQPQIVYTAARVRDARRPQAAERFLSHLRSPAAREILRAAGFATPGAGAVERPR